MMMVILLCCSSQAIADQVGDYKYSVTANQAKIIGYTGAVSNIVIPSELGGYPVTSIGSGAFNNCTGIKSISVPDGVTRIGDNAFDGCSGLTSISLPQGLTSIGDCIFMNCAGLTSISLPQGVISIGTSAFRFCTGLSSISLPQTVTSIGEAAFAGCTSLTRVDLPQAATSIGWAAFTDCSGLTSVSIPQGVTSIGGFAFGNCTGLTSITFNSPSTSISDNEGTIPTTAMIIGYESSTAKDYADRYVRDFEVIGTTKTLQSIAITAPATKLVYTMGDQLDMSGLEVTGEYSDNSHQIEPITVSDVTGFDSSAINNDETLTITYGDKTATFTVAIQAAPMESRTLLDIAITSPVAKREYNVGDQLDISGLVVTGFYSDNTTQEEQIDDICVSGFNSQEVAANQMLTVTVNGKTAYYNVHIVGLTYKYQVVNGQAQITACTGVGGEIVIIPSELGGYTVTGITAISAPRRKELSFQITDFDGITGIIIPQSIISISPGAFQDIPNMTSITVDGDNPNYASIDGVLYNKSMSVLLECPRGLTNISVPQGVTAIDDAALRECNYITSISLPVGLISIGLGAFGNCYDLPSIIIPETVTSIGAYAFIGCESLTSISIPEGVSSIEHDTFSLCKNLRNIIIPQTVTTIGGAAFYYCSNLTDIHIPQAVTSINGNLFPGCSGLMSITVDPDNLNYASVDGLLYNKAGTILMACPGGISIAELPPTVTTIGYGAFYGCYNLTSIAIPPAVTSIDNNAFADCPNLTSIVIPEGVTSLGSLGNDANAFNVETSPAVLRLMPGVTKSVGNVKSVSDGKGVMRIAAASIMSLVAISSSDDSITFEGVFDGCTSLASITFKNANTIIKDDPKTIPENTKIFGYNPSTAKDYADIYGREFHEIAEDTEAPIISIGEYPNYPTNQDITVTATTNEGTLNETSHTFIENGSFDFIATDEAGNSTSVTVTITNIDKLPPEIISNVNDYDVLPIGTVLEFSSTDPNSSQPVDIQAKLISGAEETVIPSGYGPSAGVYKLIINATDIAGNTTCRSTNLVIYDPDGGFVTGGGWINSPEGAYAPNSEISGKATFGFVSKYKKGATTPTGQTEFAFELADMRFYSSNYKWLVVAGSKAQFKGTGTLNGSGEYGFILTAVDGDRNSSDKADRFRIKIWNISGEETVYDNQFDTDEVADLTKQSTIIGGGSIVIHK
jgi:hypothetical protein